MSCGGFECPSGRSFLERDQEFRGFSALLSYDFANRLGSYVRLVEAAEKVLARPDWLSEP